MIEHGSDELYEIDNHAKFESFRLLDNGTAVVKETFSPGQTSWNSTSAWNNHAREDENKLFEDSDGSIQVERGKSFLPETQIVFLEFGCAV